MAVDRCVCHSIPFWQLKELADRLGPDVDVETLAEETGAGTGCGTCRPYIEWMLATGRTDFPVLPPGMGPPIPPKPHADEPGSGDEPERA